VTVARHKQLTIPSLATRVCRSGRR